MAAGGSAAAATEALGAWRRRCFWGFGREHHAELWQLLLRAAFLGVYGVAWAVIYNTLLMRPRLFERTYGGWTDTATAVMVYVSYTATSAAVLATEAWRGGALLRIYLAQASALRCLGLEAGQYWALRPWWSINRYVVLTAALLIGYDLWFTCITGCEVLVSHVFLVAFLVMELMCILLYCLCSCVMIPCEVLLTVRLRLLLQDGPALLATPQAFIDRLGAIVDEVQAISSIFEPYIVISTFLWTLTLMSKTAGYAIKFISKTPPNRTDYMSLGNLGLYGCLWLQPLAIAWSVNRTWMSFVRDLNDMSPDTGSSLQSLPSTELGVDRAWMRQNLELVIRYAERKQVGLRCFGIVIGQAWMQRTTFINLGITFAGALLMRAYRI